MFEGPFQYQAWERTDVDIDEEDAEEEEGEEEEVEITGDEEEVSNNLSQLSLDFAANLTVIDIEMQISLIEAFCYWCMCRASNLLVFTSK